MKYTYMGKQFMSARWRGKIGTATIPETSLIVSSESNYYRRNRANGIPYSSCTFSVSNYDGLRKLVSDCVIGYENHTGKFYFTDQPDLQFVYHAIQDCTKLAYLPAKKIGKFDGSDAYLLKYGKMVSYKKFCEKFNTTFFTKPPQPVECTLSIEDEICEVYDDERNISSCMAGECHLTSFYQEIGCEILVSRDDDGKVNGRAIIWNSHKLHGSGTVYPKLLDRCYSSENEIKDRMRQFAKDNGWDVRKSDEPYFSPFLSGNKYIVPCHRTENIPWLDTLKYYDNGHINNFSGLECQNTSGTTIGHICEECECSVAEIEINGYWYCDNCVNWSDYYSRYIIDAVYCDGDYYEEGDIETINRRSYVRWDEGIIYDDVDDCYILSDESVYCESENLTTHIDNAYQCEECEGWFTELKENLCEECSKKLVENEV